MSSDHPDKTVFKQPSVQHDRTVIRPTPGRRGAAQTPAQSTRPDSIQQPAQHQQTVATPQYQPQASAPQPQSTADGYFSTQRGLNPLVNAASTLIAVFEKTRQTVSHPNVGGLHQRLVNEIKQFENKAKETGIAPEIILSARYVVCVALDEAVLNTPWGSESAWTQRTLLSIFHNETAGGEKFFQILDRMKAYPAENLHILELMYVFLSLGFEGKYRVIDRGRDQIEQLRDDLFAIIRSQRGDYERALSPGWQGLGKSSSSLAHSVPMWVVVSVITTLLFLSYSGFRYWLYDTSTPVVQQLDSIANMQSDNIKKTEN